MWGLQRSGQASIGRRGKCSVGNVTSPLLNFASRTASPAVLLLLRHCTVHQTHAGNVKCGPGISRCSTLHYFYVCPMSYLDSTQTPKKKTETNSITVGVACEE